MFPITTDLVASSVDLLDSGQDFVVVEEHPDYPGCLTFQPWICDRQSFFSTYRDWISRHLVLNELFSLEGFVEQLQTDGYAVLFSANCKPVLDSHERWSAPLQVGNYDLKPFQSFCLRQAIERVVQGDTTGERSFFFNWSAGSGKSFCSGAGIHYLIENGHVDLVIACTLSKLKENLRRFYSDMAQMIAVVNDHVKPATRHERYHQPDVDVFVMNYEKLRVDLSTLEDLVAGKRVLFILDEAHKVISDEKPNKARLALERLVEGCYATLWPMSATVVGGNPLRYRDVFAIDGSGPRRNPLGTKADFVARYAESAKTIPIKTRNGGRFELAVYNWDLPALHEVRHRVADRTMAVRKTDSAVRDQFKGIETIPLRLQASPEQRRLFGLITDQAREAKIRGETLMPYYRLLRYAAINPEALTLTDDEVGAALVEQYPELMRAEHSVKIEVLKDMLEGIEQAQDKAVLFCHWTHLGLLLLERHFNVPYALHYGEQTARESQQAQERFLTDPSVTLFASSDAGSHGLNLPVARYVINMDPLYSYDDLAQRNARIDRLDSHLTGLTAYVYLIEDSVEDRVWTICNERRELAAAIQGTAEELSYGEHKNRTEAQSLEYLIFGSEE